MSIDYGLALIGALVIVLAIVREAARQYKLRRERKRHTVRYYWQPEDTLGSFADIRVRSPGRDR